MHVSAPRMFSAQREEDIGSLRARATNGCGLTCGKQTWSPGRTLTTSNCSVSSLTHMPVWTLVLSTLLGAQHLWSKAYFSSPFAYVAGILTHNIPYMFILIYLW